MNYVLKFWLKLIYVFFPIFFSLSPLLQCTECKIGNSNSVANLVENENPTSMQSVPINDDMLPNMDTDTLGNLTPFNNMKGSYNNLFCDNLDDDTVQTFDQNDPANVQTTNQILENVYCNISPAIQTTQINGKTANDTAAATTTTTTPTTKNANHIVDNLHVYSNVSNTAISISEPVPISTLTTTASTTTHSASKVIDTVAAHTSTLPSAKSKSTNDNALNLSNIESIISQSMKSTNMLSDNLNDLDLDLDDPTLVSSSIANTPNTSTMSKVLKSNNDSIGLSSSKFNSTKKHSKQSLSIDESRSSISKKLFNETAASVELMTDGENGNGSYLRSLHDTTMIDTALDLDSIEDANIGIENVS